MSLTAVLAIAYGSFDWMQRATEAHTHTHTYLYYAKCLTIYSAWVMTYLLLDLSFTFLLMALHCRCQPLQTGFPGSPIRDALVGISQWEPLEDGRERKKNRCLLLSLWAFNVPLIITMGWLQPGKPTLSPTAVSDSSGPLSQFLTQTGSDSLLPPLWAALILSSVSQMTLNPILTTCIPVSAALNKWLVHVRPRRLSVCESTTVFNPVFCRKTHAVSRKGEAGWRSCQFGSTRLGSIVQVTGHPALFPQHSRELNYVCSSDTPLPNPHPIVQNARLYLMDIPGPFTAPFSAHGLHCVPGCATF